MRCLLGALTVALALLAGGASAQNPDKWARYKPRTLKELFNAHIAATLKDPDIVTTRPDGTETVIAIQTFASKVKATCTGLSRKVPPIRKQLIQDWLKTSNLKPEYANYFLTEFQFREGPLELWMPIQDQIVPDFQQIRPKGKDVYLYTIWIGTIGTNREAGKMDSVLLVNEFERK